MPHARRLVAYYLPRCAAASAERPPGVCRDTGHNESCAPGRRFNGNDQRLFDSLHRGGERRLYRQPAITCRGFEGRAGFPFIRFAEILIAGADSPSENEFWKEE
jgi:hypothetical protein